MTIEEHDDQIKRFVYTDAETGDRAEIAHKQGALTATLSYVGFHGNAQLGLPVEALGVAEALLARMREAIAPAPAEEEEAPPVGESPDQPAPEQADVEFLPISDLEE